MAHGKSIAVIAVILVVVLASTCLAIHSDFVGNETTATAGGLMS